MNWEQQLQKLNQIGIALSSERDLDMLLEKILTEARHFTRAEAASLYAKKKNVLCFLISQNEVLQKNSTFTKFVFSNEPLALSTKSIAGYVALTGEVVNIADVYQLPTRSLYQFDHSFDEKNCYRTRSMLVVPMKDIQGEVIGLIALINARNERNEIIPFRQEYESLVLSLASQAAVAYLNADLTRKLNEAYLDIIFRLAMAAECREPDIKGHLQRISRYSEILAKKLGLSSQQVKNIRYASPMHDVGKIGIPDSILLKPGKLSSEEYEEMKKHSEYGANILAHSDVPILQLSEQIALTHHEHYDGNGYPNEIKGEEIPLAGRIVALADVYDALSSQRHYKKQWKLEDTVKYIRQRAGSQFDPMVVLAFEDCLDEFMAN